mmetsp:Transcript_2164/g.4689  ORF Transcript_2164/g.4689 Transcript_2164/m.4689 type:complete len:95 (+) Transcript_2164:515-799(+)
MWSKLFPTRSNALTTVLKGKPFITSSCTLEGYSSTGKSRCGRVGEEEEGESLLRATATEEEEAAAATGMFSCEGQGRYVVADEAAAAVAAAGAL